MMHSLSVPDFILQMKCKFHDHLHLLFFHHDANAILLLIFDTSISNSNSFMEHYIYIYVTDTAKQLQIWLRHLFALIRWYGELQTKKQQLIIKEMKFESVKINKTMNDN